MRRAALLMASRAFAQALTFATAVAMAHAFRVEEYGKFVFAQALASILIVIVDHGGVFHLVQRYARHPEAAPPGFSRSWAIRLALFALVPLLVAAVFALDRSDRARVVVAAIVLVGGWWDGSLQLAFAAFRIEERFSREAAWTAIGAVLRVVLTFGAIASKLALAPLLLLLTLGKTVTALGAMAQARRRVPFSWRGDWRGAGGDLRESLPFLAFSVAGIVYFQMGTLLVTHLSGPREAAIYQSAYMLFLGGMLVPDSFTSAAYPRLARIFAHDRSSFGAVTRGFLARSLVIGVVLGAGLGFAGPWVVTRLFPAEFTDSVVLFGWLGGALALRSVSYALGTLLHAADGQGLRAMNNGGSLVVLLAAAIWRVPRFGALGMVQAFLLSEALLVGFEVWGLRAALSRRPREVLA